MTDYDLKQSPLKPWIGVTKTDPTRPSPCRIIQEPELDTELDDLRTELIAERLRAKYLEQQLEALQSSVSSEEGKREALAADLQQLRARVVHNAGKNTLALEPRWRHVESATGYGRTASRQLCLDAGVDPDEIV